MNEIKMARERTSRNYLFGRLLAVADFLEEKSYEQGKHFETVARRLQVSFQRHPCETWMEITHRLRFARSKMIAKNPRMYELLQKEQQDIMWLFTAPEEFTRDRILSGEYLMAYECEKQWLAEEIKTNKKGEM